MWVVVREPSGVKSLVVRERIANDQDTKEGAGRWRNSRRVQRSRTNRSKRCSPRFRSAESSLRLRDTDVTPIQETTPHITFITFPFGYTIYACRRRGPQTTQRYHGHRRSSDEGSENQPFHQASVHHWRNHLHRNYCSSLDPLRILEVLTSLTLSSSRSSVLLILEGRHDIVNNGTQIWIRDTHQAGKQINI